MDPAQRGLDLGELALQRLLLLAELGLGALEVGQVGAGPVALGSQDSGLGAELQAFAELVYATKDNASRNGRKPFTAGERECVGLRSRFQTNGLGDGKT